MIPLLPRPKSEIFVALRALSLHLCLLFAVLSLPEAGPPPFICHGYFGLARNAKTVISITKKRDVGHLPEGGLRRR
jgi:hypothetical protein